MFRYLVSHKYSNYFIYQLQTYCGIQQDGSITNNHLYYYFKFASMLGEESYSLMPLVIYFYYELSQSLITYFICFLLCGQILKDFMKCPRPRNDHVDGDYKIIKLETHFETEYGLPSVHTIGGMLPISLILTYYKYCSSDRVLTYTYWTQCCTCLFLYSISIAVSRLYMGVHSPIDIIAGYVMTIMLSGVLYQYDGYLNDIFYNRHLSSVYAVACLLIFFLAYYPKTRPWSVSFGTASMVIGSWVGFGLGFIALKHFVILYHGQVVSLEDVYVSQSLMHTQEAGTAVASTGVISQLSITAMIAQASIGLLVALLSKMICKYACTLVWTRVFHLGLLPIHHREQSDMMGNPVPIENAYWFQVPIRLACDAYNFYLCMHTTLYDTLAWCRIFTYAVASFAAIVAAPYIWLHFRFIE